MLRPYAVGGAKAVVGPCIMDVHVISPERIRIQFITMFLPSSWQVVWSRCFIHFSFFPSSVFHLCTQSINESINLYLYSVKSHPESRFETALFVQSEGKKHLRKRDVTVVGENSPVGRNPVQIQTLAGRHLPTTFPQGNEWL